MSGRSRSGQPVPRRPGTRTCVCPARRKHDVRLADRRRRAPRASDRNTRRSLRPYAPITRRNGRRRIRGILERTEDRLCRRRGPRHEPACTGTARVSRVTATAGTPPGPGREPAFQLRQVPGIRTLPPLDRSGEAWPLPGCGCRKPAAGHGTERPARLAKIAQQAVPLMTPDATQRLSGMRPSAAAARSRSTTRSAKKPAPGSAPAARSPGLSAPRHHPGPEPRQGRGK